MKADDRHELEGLTDEIRALAARLQRHDQPLAVQLLEMVVLELKSRIHGIGDEEFDALVDALSREGSLPQAVEPADTREPYELPARTLPSARIVALGDVRRGKCKRRS